MIKCNGCGFNVEPGNAVEMTEFSDTTCEKCTKCQANPDLAECYRRGFNAGLEALATSVRNIVDHSNLRKLPKS